MTTYKITTLPYLIKYKLDRDTSGYVGRNKKGFDDNITFYVDSYWFSCRYESGDIIIFNSEHCLCFSSKKGKDLFEVEGKSVDVDSLLLDINNGLNPGVQIVT